MAYMESAPLLLIPEDEYEPSVTSPRLAKSHSFSDSGACFGCCMFKHGEERPNQIDSTHRDWWANGLSKSMRRATQWSESIIDDVGGKRWKNLVRRVKNIYSNNGERVKKGRPRFHYDAASYALNFDDGDGGDEEFNNDEFSAIGLQRRENHSCLI